MNKFQKLAEEIGCSVWQAKYITEPGRRKGEYKPRPRRGWTPEEMDQLGIAVEPCEYSEYGWKFIRNGKRRAIFTIKGTIYKDGGCKYYPAITTTVDRKPKTISLAALIWVSYLRREIPAGYVVDHIDNDSFNNDPENLQLLTIRQNVEKNPAKKMIKK